MSAKSPKRIDKEGSELYIFGVGKLFHESLDLISEIANRESGTIPGAMIQSVRGVFQNLNTVLAKAKAEEGISAADMESESPSWRVFNVVKEYLDILPDSKSELVEIVYEVCESKDLDSILMLNIPVGIQHKLKLLNGGRWQIERIEAELWSLANNRR